jgi:hypothetical protein
MSSGCSRRLLGALAALAASAALSGCAVYSDGFGGIGYGGGYYAPSYGYAPGGFGWGGWDDREGGWDGGSRWGGGEDDD